MANRWVVQNLTVQDKVTELYVATLGRAPDHDGLAYWVNEISAGRLTIEQAAKSFFDQPETKTLYPAGTTNNAFVIAVYQNAFDRDPDQAGLNYWVNELNLNRVSRDQFILAILQGAYDDTAANSFDASLLTNQHKAAEYFANSTDPGGAFLALYPWTGTAAQKATFLLNAERVLEPVTASASTIAVSQKLSDALLRNPLDATFVLTADPTVSVDEGQTIVFTLTTANVESGESYNYTITGVQPSDVETGQLTGSITIGNDGKALIPIRLVADRLTEGAETLTLTVADQVARVVVNDTSVTQTFVLTSNAPSVNEGNTVFFTLATTNVATGSNFAYFISGVQAADVEGGQLSGTVTIDNFGRAVIPVRLVADHITEGPETLTVTVAGQSLGVTVNDISPDFTLAAADTSVDEGNATFFTLTNGQPGARYDYTLSGVQASDVVGGQLSGSVTIDSSGRATIPVTLTADRVTEGSETLSVTVAGQTASVVVNDTSNNLTLTNANASVDEGNTTTFILANGKPGSSYVYTLSGVQAADVEGGHLTGTVTVDNNGVAQIPVTLVADRVTEGSETLTVTVADLTRSVVVNDTSTNFTLTAGGASVNEGDATVFTIANGQPGARYDYVISGVQAADVQGGQLAGTVTIGQDGTAQISVRLLADRVTEGPETLQVNVADRVASIVVNDTSTALTLTNADAAVNEGATTTFILANGHPGASYAYAISGVQAADVEGGHLSGTVTIDNNGVAQIPVTLVADRVTEGSETLTVTVADLTSSVAVNDTSINFTLAANPTTVDEGQATVFTLTNGQPGASYDYVLSGVEAGDVEGGKLAGTVTIGQDGTAQVSVTLVADRLTEGTQTLQMNVADQVATVTVNDTSTALTLANADAAVSEGATTTFLLTFGQPGAHYNYTISGVQAADVVGGQLTGTVTIDNTGTAQIPVTLVADRITEGSETLTVTVADLTSSVTVTDSSTDFVLTAVNANINEGQAAVFTLTDGQPGASYAYEISGVDAADVVGGKLTGTVTIGADGVGRVSVQLVADRLTEGAETLSLTVAGGTPTAPVPQTATVTVADTSTNLTLTNADAAVDEGATTTFLLTFGEPGRSYEYTLHGVDAADVVGGQLTGTVTIDNTGTAQIPVALVADRITEGAATLTMTVADLTSSVTVNDTSTDFVLAAVTPAINEGQAAVFTLTDGQPGASYAYEIAGVDAADVVGGQLAGTVTIGADGVGRVSVQLVADRLTEGPEILSLTVAGGTPTAPVVQIASVTVADTSTNMTLTNANASVNEGATTTFVLAFGEPGRTYEYQISGVSAADVVGGQLTGSVTIDNNGVAQIPVTLVADRLTETVAETLTVTVADLTSSVVVTDSSQDFVLATTTPNVNEGQAAVFTLTGGQPGASYAYAITGVDAADVVGGQLTGNVTIGADGVGRITVDLATDRLTEGAETLSLTVAGGTPTAPVPQTVKVAVADTSTNLTLSNQAADVNDPARAVNEGSTQTFFLAHAAPGASYEYTLSGVQAADVEGGQLTGTVTIDNDGIGRIQVGLVKDYTTEGNETLKVSVANLESSVTVTDSSLNFVLSNVDASVNEGATTTFKVTGGEPGATYDYTITGSVQAADIQDGKLTGTVTIGNDGVGLIPVALVADFLQEGEETLTMTVANQAQTVTIKVNDNSTPATLQFTTSATDNLKGTEKDDVFNAEVSDQIFQPTAPTLNAGDTADGLNGAKDRVIITANIDSVAPSVSGFTFKNIEEIEVRSYTAPGDGVTLGLQNVDKALTTVYSTKSTGDITLNSVNNGQGVSGLVDLDLTGNGAIGTTVTVNYTAAASNSPTDIQNIKLDNFGEANPQRGVVAVNGVTQADITTYHVPANALDTKDGSVVTLVGNQFTTVNATGDQKLNLIVDADGLVSKTANVIDEYGHSEYANLANALTKVNAATLTDSFTFNLGVNSQALLITGSTTATNAIDAHQATGNVTVTGGAVNDWISTGSGNDILTGSTGNDTLDSGSGNDSIVAGEGDDMVIFNVPNDTRAGLTVADTVDGGLGNDILVIDGNSVPGPIALGASEWTNVSGFETIKLVNAGVGSSYNLTLTNGLIDSNNNGQGLLAIVNDNDPVNDASGAADAAGNAESPVVIDARSLSAGRSFSYNGEEGVSRTADRFILSDVSLDGKHVIDGGAVSSNPTLNLLSAANADVLEVRNAAVASIGDFANIKNVGIIELSSDQVAAQITTVQLNDAIVDLMVDSYRPSSAGNVERLTVRALDTDPANLASATMGLVLQAGGLTGLTDKSALDVLVGRGDNNIATGAGADTLTLLGNYATGAYAGKTAAGKAVSTLGNNAAGAEVVTGTYDLGGGSDKLVTYGAINLAGATLSGIDTFEFNSNVTVKASQLLGHDVIFNSPGPHTLTIVDDLTGTGQVLDFERFTLALGSQDATIFTGTTPFVGDGNDLSAVGNIIINGYNLITLPIASSTTSVAVSATVKADMLSFDLGGALSTVAVPGQEAPITQIQVSGFDLIADLLRVDVPGATGLGLTKLSQLNGLDLGGGPVAVQFNPFTSSTVINFGSDAAGDAVTVTLAGVTDPSLVNITVV